MTALAVLGLAATALAGVAVVSLGAEDEPQRRAAKADGATATVSRRTLVARETVTGTLGFGGTRVVVNRLGASANGSGEGGGSGADPAGTSPAAVLDHPAGGREGQDSSPETAGTNTLTALPRPGSIVRRGGALYRVDGDPVVLMYGRTPAYRGMRAGVEDGDDVEQLERNLESLGFDPGTVDETFTSDTAAAVADWQDANDLQETGKVELGRVVFLPGARRVGERKAAIGTVLSDGVEVLDTSSIARVVSIELDAALQSIARRGDRVTVTLPDGGSVRGRITAVGRVAREADSGESDDPGGSTGEPELVVDVTVRLGSTRRLGRLDEAPVGVGLAQETRRNVLAVPVNALVARAGGGYGVELAGSHRIVPVEAGMFADGYVEVSGRAIREGARVVVPDD